MTRTVALLVMMLLAWAILYYGYWVLVRRRFVVISPRGVYQSGAMWPWWLIRNARRYRIDTVIDFRGAHEEVTRLQARALAAARISCINIPIGALPTPDDVERFLDTMREELEAGRRVLMHCKDGQGRAIAMAAIYRIEFEGWTALKAYRAGTRLPPGFKFVAFVYPSAGCLSARNSKRQFILGYQPVRQTLGMPARACVGEARV
jgi:hypothetical protein